MEKAAKFKDSYRRFRATAAIFSDSLPLLFHPEGDSTSAGLPSTAALLKGELTVIVEGRFAFLNHPPTLPPPGLPAARGM